MDNNIISCECRVRFGGLYVNRKAHVSNVSDNISIIISIETAQWVSPARRTPVSRVDTSSPVFIATEVVTAESRWSHLAVGGPKLVIDDAVGRVLEGAAC